MASGRLASARSRAEVIDDRYGRQSDKHQCQWNRRDATQVLKAGSASHATDEESQRQPTQQSQPTSIRRQSVCP